MAAADRVGGFETSANVRQEVNPGIFFAEPGFRMELEITQSSRFLTPILTRRSMADTVTSAAEFS